MNNASSALAAAGNTFDQSVALLTAANTVVQNASKSSTGLRTIAARLRNTTADLEELGEDMTKAKYDELVSKLTKLSVSLTDVNGEYRSTYDILRDIAAKWQDLSSMEQAALATAIAGTRQQAIFFSIIDQFKEASGAMDAMANSAEELDKAYTVYLDSIEAHINKFKTAFQDLAQDVATRELINDVIDLGAKLLDLVKVIAKVVDALGGIQVVLPTILGAVGTTKLAGSIGNITKKLAEAGTAAKGFTGALKAIGGAGAAVSVPVGIAAAAISGLVLAYSAYQKHKETQMANAAAAGEEFSNAAAKAEEYKKKIADLKDAIDNGNLSEEEAYDARKQLVDLQDELETFYGKEIDNLDLVRNGADEAAKAIDRETAAIAHRALEENKAAYEKARMQMESRQLFITPAGGRFLDTNNKELQAEVDSVINKYSGISRLGNNLNFVGTAREIANQTESALDELNKLLRDSRFADDDSATAFIKGWADKVRYGFNQAKRIIDEFGTTYEAYLSERIAYVDDYSGIDQQLNRATADLNLVLNDASTSMEDKVAAISAFASVISDLQDQVKNTTFEETDAGVRAQFEARIEEFAEFAQRQLDKHKLRLNLSTGTELRSQVQRVLSEFVGADGTIRSATIKSIGLGDPRATQKQTLAYYQLDKIAKQYRITVDELIETLEELEFFSTGAGDFGTAVSNAFNIEPVNKFKESISALKSAFDDLGKEGSVGITASSVEALKEKFANVTGGVDTFIDRLFDAGTDVEQFSQILTELAIAKLESSDATNDLADVDERLIAAMMREVGVANADEAAQMALSKAKAKVQFESMVAKDGIDKVIASLSNEASYTDSARKEMARLAAQFIMLNNQNLDLSQQIQQFMALGNAVGYPIAMLQAFSNIPSPGSTSKVVKPSQMRGTAGMEADSGTGTKMTQQDAINQWYKGFMADISNLFKIDFTSPLDKTTPPGGGGGGAVEKYVADIDRFYEALKRVESIEQRIGRLQSQIENSEDMDERIELTKQLINSYKEESTAMQELNRQRTEGIQGAIGDLQALGFVISYNAETNELLVQNMSHLNELEAGSTEATNELRKETEELIKDIESWNDANQQTSESLNGITNNIREARDAMVEYLQEAVEKANEMVDGLENVYQVLTNAAKEYAENGFLSVDSLQSILELGPKYMAMLVDENGQLVLNEENLQKLIAARTQEMAAETALSYAKQILLATETGEVETLQQLTQVDIAASNATWDMAYATLALAKAIGTANGVQESYYEDAFSYIKKMQSVTQTAVNSISAYYETLNDNYISQKDALDQILKLTEDMIKWENDQHIKALEDEKNAYGDIINQKKELIRLAKEQADREKSVQQKLEEIAKLQAKIAQLSLDDSREAQAQKSKLEEELAELQRSLADEQMGYSVDAQEEALDKQLEAFNNEKDKEIEGLQDMLQSAEQLYQAAIARIENGWDSLYRDLMSWNESYGQTLSKDLVNAWDAASQAVQRYGGFVQALEGTAGHTGLGGYDDNPAGADSYTNFTDTRRANESIARSIVERMKANSAKWTSADDAGRVALANENEQLGRELGAMLGANVYRDQNGVWWIDGKRLYDVYHKGGIVGNSSTRQQDEVMALLQKGEAVLDSQRERGLYKIVDFVSVLSKRLGSALDSGRIDRVFGSGMGLPSLLGAMPSLASPQLAAAGGYHIDRIEVTAPVYVSEKLSDDDIREHARVIGSISADYIREGFTKRGVRQNASLF